MLPARLMLQAGSGSAARGAASVGFLSAEKSWAMQDGAAYLLLLHLGSVRG